MTGYTISDSGWITAATTTGGTCNAQIWIPSTAITSTGSTIIINNTTSVTCDSITWEEQSRAVIRRMNAAREAHAALDRSWIQWVGSANLSEAEYQAQVRAQRDRDEVSRAAWAARERTIAAANDRAEELLLSHLSREQRAAYQQRRSFHVVSPAGRRYRIERGRSRNVRLVDADDRILRTYCAHPSDAVPDCDTMLAQMLMIRTDEAAFLRIANAS